MKRVNLETIIDMQSWCRIRPPNGSSRIRAKQKRLRKHKGTCKSSWSPKGSLKSFTLTIPWNLAKLVKIFLGIIARLHHTDRRLMVLRKEQCAEWRKAPLLYCCNQVWMKVGGQILWNVTPICETSQIYYLMGRRPVKDVLGNHLKDQLFHLVHWLSITLSPRKTSQESINLEGKFYLDCSSDTLSTRGEFGKVTYWSQTLRSWKRWTHRKSIQKDSMRKRWYFPNKENLFFQSQMDESKLPEEIRNWEHPPWYGRDQIEEQRIDHNTVQKYHDACATTPVHVCWRKNNKGQATTQKFGHFQHHLRSNLRREIRGRFQSINAHVEQKKIWAQKSWKLFKDPETLRRLSQPMERCKRMRKQ